MLGLKLTHVSKMYASGWETKFFWHSPELGSLLYSLYKIPLGQICFPLAQPNFHSHWRALVSQPAPGVQSLPWRIFWVLLLCRRAQYSFMIHQHNDVTPALRPLKSPPTRLSVQQLVQRYLQLSHYYLFFFHPVYIKLYCSFHHWHTSFSFSGGLHASSQIWP